MSSVRIDHLYVTVSDLPRAEAFYDPVMQALGFRRRASTIGGDPHVHYVGPSMQYTIRPGRSAGVVDGYRPGSIHHLCFQVRDAQAVDEAHASLRALGVDATAPRLYSEYRPDYYATFFRDPDGIRLEIVGETGARRMLRDRWSDFETFDDPIGDLVRRRPELAAELTSRPVFTRGSLLEDSAPPTSGERFETLAHLGGVRVERIVSSNHPDAVDYVQDHDEWVVLVRGTARLDVAGEIVELVAGDHVLLPARTPHRVVHTSEGALWLALHAV